jgi:uncharacterized protein (DUF58 family)
VTRPGSLVILVSDFRFLDDTCRIHLSELAKHNDVVLLFTHDPLEQALPPSGRYRLTDGEIEVSFDSANAASRDLYARRFTGHYEGLVNLCDQLKLFLLDVSTTSDLLTSLQSGLGLKR